MSLLSVVAALALVVCVLSTATPGRAAGFDPNESWTWSASEPLLDSGTAKAARVERLPGGRLAALMVVAGSAYGQASGDVLVTRVREESGTWGAPEVVPLGAESPATRTFDSFADSAGRIVAVWAVKATTAGQWPVRSVSRSAGGVWSVPEELYVARTDGALGDVLEIAGIAPRLVPFGDTVTLAWATVANASSSRVPVTDNPFRAKRWTAGAWGSVIVSDGYGSEAFAVQPMLPDTTSIWANPSQSSRTSDGRISFVYSLYKHRATHSMNHPLSEGFTGPNVANVWDGIAERPWDATSTTAWVMHLDPGQGWSAPAKLVVSGESPVSCAAVDLPTNPPLAAHWAEWKAFSLNPGITTSCPGEHSRTRSASYAADGQLRIELDYSSDPSAEVVLNQFLDEPCDDPTPTSIFCFDDWGSTDWGTDWPTAGIAVAPGASRPAAAAVRETSYGADLSTRVGTTSGTVTVVGVGSTIRFERAGSEVVWTPDAADPTAVRVQRAFAHGADVAVFYYRGTSSTSDCGMAVLHGGTMTVDGPISACFAGPDAAQQDVIQLPDGRLASINGKLTRSPVRIYGPTSDPTQTPTSPSPTPSPPAPSPSAPTAPAPSSPAPAPPASTFTATAQPTVTGKPKVGRRLTARPGTWTPVPATVSYKWFANGKLVRRATSTKLRLTAKLEGKRISVRITLTRPGVTTTVRTVKVRGRVR
ncbi:hypothetical protein [Nocardioides glacieisoli]|uniref:hypothetical protein n=1 Tax=Nocardioides glacieisoli TaxID=1168730 RepID=UPI0013ED28B6|nr:hypothetical protein [Nocardioides glacieisoli]